LSVHPLLSWCIVRCERKGSSFKIERKGQEEGKHSCVADRIIDILQHKPG